MKLDDLLRGPSRKSVKLGKTEEYTRIGLTRKYPMLRAVYISYTPVQFIRNYLFPWVRGFETTIWHMNVVVETKSGRRFEYRIISESNMQTALDYGYIQGIGRTLIALRDEIQQVARRKV